MNINEHKACYGTMFPDPRSVSSDQGGRGKVFSLHFVQPLGLSRSRPQVREGPAEWDDCLRCPEFDSCYRLGMARIALHGLAEDA